MYNNATERTKIIYVGTLAGVIPGGPGHSHQSVRDISAIGAIPGLTAIEPCNEREARLAIRWAVEQNEGSTYLRFVNVPMDLPYALPASYAMEVGRGTVVRPGVDVAFVGYGPMLLTQAWTAADALAADGISAAIVDLPWLNRIDDDWVRDLLGRFSTIVTLDNQYVSMGQGTMVAAALARTRVNAQVMSVGLTDVPACGGNVEVLARHGLDGASIASYVASAFRRTSVDRVRSG
jgi:transketolase